MNPLILTMLGALLRMLLLGAFGGLIERGVWTTGQVEQIAIGLAGFLITAVWALWKHYTRRVRFLTALQMPPGITEAHIDATIKAGLGASVTGGEK